MPADRPARASEIAEVLREPAFRRYLASYAFAPLGDSLFAATVLWHVYELTDDALYLAGVGLAQFLPTAALSLVGGAFADAHSRTAILVTRQLAMALCGLLLCVSSATGEIPLPLLYAGLAVSSSTAAFANPASSALLPSLVPPHALARALTLGTTARTSAVMAGPVLFGLGGSAFGGLAPIYGLHAALCLAAAAIFAGVRPHYASGARRPVSWAAVREGLLFVRGQPAILAAMSLDMVAVVFAGATALLPIYARDVLHVGKLGFGLLAASLEIGTTLMGVLLLALPAIRRPGLGLLGAVGGFGLATLLFGASTRFELSVLALVLAGMADQVSMVSRSLILQLSTPDALRGRVSSVNMLFIGTSNQLGTVESGLLTAATSAQFAVLFGGVACLLALAAAALGVPALRRYATGPPPQAAPGTPAARQQRSG